MKTIGVILGVVALLLAPVIVYRMFQAHKMVLQGQAKKTALDELFGAYAKALEQGHFEMAYDIGSTEFKATTSVQAFRDVFLKLEKEHGPLKRVRVLASPMRGRGVGPGGSQPMVYIGHIEAEFEYEKQKVRVMHEFHEENGKWVLHGFKVPWIGSILGRDPSSAFALLTLRSG